MTDLRKAAQDVVDMFFADGIIDVTAAKDLRAYCAFHVLREALQAGTEKPVGEICFTPQVFNIGANIFDCTIQFELSHIPKQGDRLYTTPPSIDALIAEIDALHRYNFFNNGMLAFDEVEVEAVLDKYRSKP